MSDPKTVKENKDNDLKYFAGIEKQRQTEEQPLSENGCPEEELEYFTD